MMGKSIKGIPSCVLIFGIVLRKTRGGCVGGCGSVGCNTTGWVRRAQCVRPMMMRSVRVTLFAPVNVQ